MINKVSVIGLGNDYCGAAEPFLDPPRDNADHALVPAATHNRDHRRVRLLRRLRLGLLAHQHLDRSALLVEPVELGGDGARFLRVGAGEEADA